MRSTSRVLAVAGAVVLCCAAKSASAQSIVPPEPPTRLPRHAAFVLDPAESSLELSLLWGSPHSKLAGTLQLYLGDPRVAVIALPGMVGLSVERADLVALDFDPDLLGQPDPVRLILDPRLPCIGSWNILTGQIAFDLRLVSASTPFGGLPVPMPIHVGGVLAQGLLKADGSNGNVPDGTVRVHFKAFESPLPPHPVDLWFSTQAGFHPGKITSDVAKPQFVSDGDLLSVRGYVVRTNRQLTARLGLMPVAPDLGLDAVLHASRGEVWFSFKREVGQVWSETLGYLRHSDLLSDAGRVVMTGRQMLAAFGPVSAAFDVGLDAVQRGPNREILFSTDDGFFCEKMNRWIGHGDLLSTRGRVVRTNAQLLANFRIIDMTMKPTPSDYGLDAIALRSNSEIWFSTRLGFHDERYGWVSDGDLLSTTGVIVARNLALLSAFQPVEDLANFGLDAVTWSLPCRVGDFDFDGDVDAADLDAFQAALSGPAMNTSLPEFGDMDGDGDTDQTDFGFIQRCITEPDSIADAACDE